jgi:hypothetical protein
MMEQMKEMISLFGKDTAGELAKFTGQFTSAEGIKNLLEYFESSEKIMDLRKNMLRE